MNYKEIQANSGTIAIGYIGDNLASKVIFDTSEITEIYGTDGVFELLIKQATGKRDHCHPATVYPAVIETDMDANTVTWIPTAQDTSSGQYMDVELCYTIDEQVVFNRMFRCVCKKSLANYTQGTAPQESWVTNVLVAAAEVKAAIEDASTSAAAAASSATSASESASAASTSASNAASSASSASGSAQAAAQSATAAQTAADSVTTATVAETKSYLGI